MGRGGAQLGKSKKGAGVDTQTSDKNTTQSPKDESDSLEQQENSMDEHTRTTSNPLDERTNSAEETKQMVLQHSLRADIMHEQSMAHAHTMRMQQRRVEAQLCYASRKQMQKQMTIVVRDQAFKFVHEKYVGEVRIQQGVEYVIELSDCANIAGKGTKKQIDDLISLHDIRMLKLNESEFDKRFEKIYTTLGNELMIQKKTHAQRMIELKQSIDELHSQFATTSKDAIAAMENERETISNQSIETMNTLRHSLDRKIIALEQRFEQEYVSYVNNTEERTSKFKGMSSRDRTLSLEIENNSRTIDMWSRDVSIWRKKIVESARECRRDNARIRAEKQAIGDIYYALKNRLLHFRSVNAAQLKDMSGCARAALLKMKSSIGIGERLIKLAEIRGSRREPWETIDVDLDGTGSVAPDEGCERYENMLEEEFDELNTLTAYTEQFNAAVYRTIVAREDRNRCRRENDELREKLQMYLGAVNTDPHVLDTRNSLLIVNGRDNILRKMPAVKPGHPANIIDT